MSCVLSLNLHHYHVSRVSVRTEETQIPNQDQQLILKIGRVYKERYWNTNSSTTSETLNILWTPSAHQARQLVV